MSWITPTAEDVLCTLSPAELIALCADEDEEAGRDRLEALVAKLIGESVSSIRGAIACCSKNRTLGPGGTIPQGAMPHVRALVLYEVLTAWNSKLAERWESRWNKACAWIVQVGNCEVGIEAPGEDGRPAIGAVVVKDRHSCGKGGPSFSQKLKRRITGRDGGPRAGYGSL